MLNPEVLQCHEDLITRGGGGASIIRLGPSWFTSTLSFILIYMSNMEAIWLEPFELK